MPIGKSNPVSFPLFFLFGTIVEGRRKKKEGKKKPPSDPVRSISVAIHALFLFPFFHLFFLSNDKR